MKKAWISMATLMLSALILLTGCLTAFAEQPKTYWEPRPDAQDAEAYVNGYEGLISVYEEWDRESDALTFWTDDFWHVTGWEFPLLTENVDYKVISKSGNKITIQQIADNPNTPFNIPYINVLVDNLEEGKKILDERSTQIDVGDQQADKQTTAKQKKAAQKAESKEKANVSDVSKPTSVTSAETQSTTELASSQELETDAQNNIPVIPIITAAAVAALAGAIGIILYKKRKNKFTK